MAIVLSSSALCHVGCFHVTPAKPIPHGKKLERKVGVGVRLATNMDRQGNHNLCCCLHSPSKTIAASKIKEGKTLIVVHRTIRSSSVDHTPLRTRFCPVFFCFPLGWTCVFHSRHLAGKLSLWNSFSLPFKPISIFSIFLKKTLLKHSLSPIFPYLHFS